MITPLNELLLLKDHTRFITYARWLCLQARSSSVPLASSSWLVQLMLSEPAILVRDPGTSKSTGIDFFLGSTSKIEGQNWLHGDLEDTLLTIVASKAMGGKKFGKLDVKRVSQRTITSQQPPDIRRSTSAIGFVIIVKLLMSELSSLSPPRPFASSFGTWDSSLSAMVLANLKSPLGVLAATAQKSTSITRKTTRTTSTLVSMIAVSVDPSMNASIWQSTQTPG